MPSALLANKNTIGSGLPYNILPLDSGNITAVQGAGKAPARLTTGLQQQATQPIQCDQTTASNFILDVTQHNPYAAAATITNITVAAAIANVNTITVVAVNTFVAGQTVRFAGLTTVPSLNNLAGVVTSTGLSSAGFQCTLVGQTVASVGSSAETGTATVNFFGKQACLSLAPNN